MWQESLHSDPVYQRFHYRQFVSKSKGRGRKRKHWKEVELVNDVNKGIRKWFTWDRYPFDDAATETCGYVENPTEYLMRRIPQICRG